MNHSCEPNLFIQPVLSHHRDKDMPRVCLYSMETIPALTELTYDYGFQYVEKRFKGGCKCGAAACVGKKKQQQEEEQAVGSAVAA